MVQERERERGGEERVAVAMRPRPSSMPPLLSRKTVSFDAKPGRQPEKTVGPLSRLGGPRVSGAGHARGGAVEGAACKNPHRGICEIYYA